MKNMFRKERIKVSPIVIRAISRLNKYEYEKKMTSIVWDGKSIVQNLSITS